MALITRSLADVAGKRKRIGDILLEKGLVSPETLEKVLLTQKKSGKRLGEILLREELITEENLYESLATQYQYDFQKPADLELNTDILKMFPREILEKFRFVPFQLLNDVFYVITADVTGSELLETIYFVTGRKAKKIISTPSFVEKMVTERILESVKSLDSVGLDKVVEDVKLEFVAEEEEDSKKKKLDFHEMNKMSSQATIINLVNKVLLMAIKDGASDIHIESFEEKVTVRFRIDGVLYVKMGSSINILNPVLSRLMIMANLDITERFLPQDGAFKLRFEGRNIEFRVATIPTIYGLNAVIRLLNVGKNLARLEQLGFRERDMKNLLHSIERPYGMILVSGPTGSGKSTTLYSMLRHLQSTETKMITIEDPVENQVDGIQQIQVKINKVDPNKSLTFARGLRSVLRLDPDIIMVGEIRDAETAEIAVRAALTGHLLFSTIHANTAMETIRRLQNIGVDIFTTISALNAVLAQRLVRILCRICKTPVTPPPELVEVLNYRGLLDGCDKFLDKKGCDGCGNTGYAGRMGVFEFFEISDEFRDMILAKEPFSKITRWAEEKGFLPMMMDGLEKAKRGLTSLSEVKRVLIV